MIVEGARFSLSCRGVDRRRVLSGGGSVGSNIAMAARNVQQLYCGGMSVRSLVTCSALSRRWEQGMLSVKRGGVRGGKSVAKALAVEGDTDGSGGENVQERELHKEALNSYLSYAMAVVAGRALPDVRDGLKPVQRRLMFGMRELGLASTKPHRKSARVVGEVLGKLHPHGDAALYEALVRLAQPFSCRIPLIDGHGNFGSIDDDPAAAMRYTECRLRAEAEAMLLEGLNEDAVDFVETFDGQQMEPSILPAALPTILLNGVTGIAVGMATNIPPHNVVEIAKVAKKFAADPSVSITDLQKLMPGPDFPTGGIILEDDDAMDALYRTGVAKLTLRARIHLETTAKKKRALVITEIPFMTKKSPIVEHIANLKDDGIIKGIADIRDESDRDGMRIVLDLKRDGNEQLIENGLYKHTKLQSPLSFSMLALDKNSPRVLNLSQILQCWLDFRVEVLRRRATFRKVKAEERLHIVQGYLAGIGKMDTVIEEIRSSESGTEAQERLMKLIGVTERQADALLSLPLRRLTRMDQGDFEEQEKKLTASIKDLTELLDSQEKIVATIISDIDALMKKFGNDSRRTEIAAGVSGDVKYEDVAENIPCVIMLTERGMMKRMKASVFETLLGRYAKGVKGSNLYDGDRTKFAEECNLHDTLVFFSSNGVAYQTRVHKVDESSRTARGTAMPSLFKMDPSSRITTMMTIPYEESDSEEGYVIFLTAHGVIKKMRKSEFGTRHTSQGFQAMGLDDDDELVGVTSAKKGDHVVIVSKFGMLAHIKVNPLRPMGRSARGVFGMRLGEGDRVAGMAIVPSDIKDRTGSDGPLVAVATRGGRAKLTDVDDFRVTARNCKGVKAINLYDDDEVAGVLILQGGEDVLFSTEMGNVKRMSSDSLQVSGRATRGSFGIKMADGDSLNNISVSTAFVDDENIEEADSSVVFEG